MKLIKILTILMVLTLTTSRTHVDSSLSVMHCMQNQNSGMAGKTSDAGTNGTGSCQGGKADSKTVQPSGTYDRFDPSALQGKGFSSEILVL